MEKRASARDASRAFEFPPPPIERAVHASPLHVPPLTRDIRARSRLPMWIVVNAAVVSAGIIAAALIVRSERTRTASSPSTETVTPEPAPPLLETVQPRSSSRAAPSAGAPTGSIAVTPTSQIAPELSASTPVATRPRHIAARANARNARRASARAVARDDSPADRTVQPFVVTKDTTARVNPWLAPRARTSRFPRVRYQPSRVQVIHAMQRVAPAVYACFDRGRGFAMVRIGLTGETGRVHAARVLGQAGPEASCIARAVRGARVPTFLKPTLKIDYPFKR